MSFGMWIRVGARKHVLDGVRIGATWRIWLNHPYAAVIEPYVKLFWPLIIIRCLSSSVPCTLCKGAVLARFTYCVDKTDMNWRNRGCIDHFSHIKILDLFTYLPDAGSNSCLLFSRPCLFSLGNVRSYPQMLSSVNSPPLWPWTLALTFEIYLDKFKVDHHDKYLGYRPNTQTHTTEQLLHTDTKVIAKLNMALK